MTRFLHFLTLVGVVFGMTFGGWTFAAGLPVGEAKLVLGKVEVSREDGMSSLSRGDSVFEGDLLTSDAKGFAIILLKDKSKFSLKPNTQFRIQKVNDGAGNAGVLTELVKGGVKIITGEIAKRNPDQFTINTPLGSIGVRGTRFDVWVCVDEQDCERETELFRDLIKDIDRSGRLLYTWVYEGSVFLLDCDGKPVVDTDQLGISNGSIDGCTMIDVPVELRINEVLEKEERIDDGLGTLDIPLLQQLDIDDSIFCDGDPLCIQCNGDPLCSSCNGDPHCVACNGDPLCIECAGDPLCQSCNGDKLCISCAGNGLCIACQDNPLCTQCNNDPACINCNADPLCMSCGDDKLCLCNGDTSCECAIDDDLPQCEVNNTPVLPPPVDDGGSCSFSPC